MNYSKSDLMSGALLNLYTQAVNEIEDYFEYRCKSKVDQAEVHRILDELTEKIQELTHT
jgi:hypothetical protein